MNKNILLAGTAICLLSMASIVHAQTTNNEEDTFEPFSLIKEPDGLPAMNLDQAIPKSIT